MPTPQPSPRLATAQASSLFVPRAAVLAAWSSWSCAPSLFGSFVRHSGDVDGILTGTGTFSSGSIPPAILCSATYFYGISGFGFSSGAYPFGFLCCATSVYGISGIGLSSGDYTFSLSRYRHEHSAPELLREIASDDPSSCTGTCCCTSIVYNPRDGIGNSSISFIGFTLCGTFKVGPGSFFGTDLFFILGAADSAYEATTGISSYLAALAS